MTRKRRGIAGLTLVLLGVPVLGIGFWSLLFQSWSWGFPLVVLMILGVVAFLIAGALLVFFFCVCVQEIRGVDPPEPESEEEPNGNQKEEQ